MDGLAALGIKKIIHLKADQQEAPCEELLLQGLKSLYQKKKPQHLIFGSTPSSRRLAPKLAALVQGGYIANTTYLRKTGAVLLLTRPLMQGRLSDILTFTDPGLGLIGLHPRSFSLPAASAGATGKTIMETYRLPPLPGIQRGWTVLESGEESYLYLDIEDAEIIVAGGKGIGSGKGFVLLQKLAEVLGGAVAASRIAVDLGWASKEQLVGQTGKRVSPELYIACGISGAPQHRAGMKDSRYILAINTDPAAPIFQVATWGIHGDACEVVQEMIRLKEKKND